jgi:hypothetical protein
VNNGVVNMSETDHQGLDERSCVIVQIVNGGWQLVDANALPGLERDHRHGHGSVRGEEGAALRPLYLVSVSR